MAYKQISIDKPADTIPKVYDDVLKCIVVISDLGSHFLERVDPHMKELSQIVSNLTNETDYAAVSNLMEQVDELFDAIQTAQAQFDNRTNQQMAKTAYQYSVKVRTKSGWANLPKRDYRIQAANRARKSSYRHEMNRIMQNNSSRVLAAKLQIGSGFLPKVDIDLPILGFHRRRMNTVIDTYNEMIDSVAKYQGTLTKIQANIQKALAGIDADIYPKVNQDLLMYTKISANINASLSNIMATLKQAVDYFSAARGELAALTQDIIRIRKVNR